MMYLNSTGSPTNALIRLATAEYDGKVRPTNMGLGMPLPGVISATYRLTLPLMRTGFVCRIGQLTRFWSLSNVYPQGEVPLRLHLVVPEDRAQLSVDRI